MKTNHPVLTCEIIQTDPEENAFVVRQGDCEVYRISVTSGVVST